MVGLVVVMLAVAHPSAAAAAPDEDSILAAVNRFLSAASHVDVKGIQAEVAPSTFVADDLPPFHWMGIDAFTQWAGALGKEWKLHGVAEASMTMTENLGIEIEGDDAYVPLKALLQIKAGKLKMSKTGTLVFTLVRIAGEWKIRSMAWSPAAAQTPKS